MARKAMIIGCDEYKNLSRLDNAAIDARNLGTSLRKFGWDVEMFFDIGIDEAKNRLERFTQKVSTLNEACLFAFVGHGLQLHNMEFFVFTDSMPGELSDDDFVEVIQKRCLSYRSIIEAFARSRAPFKFPSLFLFDCCRDQQMASRSLSMSKAQNNSNAILSAIQNSHITFSATSGSVASDGQPLKGGPFMNSLVTHLSREENLSIFEILMCVRRDIRGTTQLSPEESNLKGPFYFKSSVDLKINSVRL